MSDCGSAAAYGEADLARVKKSFADVTAFRRNSQLKP